MTATRKLWIFLFGLLLASFTVLLWVGGEIHRVMAAEYGVRQSTISRIVARERWKHLP